MNQRISLKMEHPGYGSAGTAGRKLLLRIVLGLIGINAVVVVVASLFNALGR